MRKTNNEETKYISKTNKITNEEVRKQDTKNWKINYVS